jgi:hypothetical protein
LLILLPTRTTFYDVQLQIRFRVRFDDKSRQIFAVAVRKERKHRHDDGLESDARSDDVAVNGVAVNDVTGSAASRPSDGSVRPVVAASPSLRHRERSSERLQSVFVVIKKRDGSTRDVWRHTGRFSVTLSPFSLTHDIILRDARRFCLIRVFLASHETFSVTSEVFASHSYGVTNDNNFEEF